MIVGVKRYLHDIVVFLRMHRAVHGGVSPQATKDFENLVRCLASLHGIMFATSSLIEIAAPKVFRHRLILTAPEDDRSLQYGSDLEAVKDSLEGLTSDMIIREVLDAVEIPV